MTLRRKLPLFTEETDGRLCDVPRVAEQLTKLLHSVPQVVGLLCKALCSGSLAPTKIVRL
jgi:hypothetical protein